MSTIYVRDPGTTLAVDSTYLTLRSKGRRIGRIPPMMVDQVILEHGVEATRTCLDRLGALGIPVTFLGPESRVQARLVPPWKADARGRIAQAKAWLDPEVRLTLARRWIDAKLANGIAVIRRYLSNHPDEALAEACQAIQRLRKEIPSTSAIASLLGIEGTAARIYFGALGGMIRAQWTEFSGRNRRPPLDPVNAVLSYVYAVLCHQILALIEAMGLDPYIGYLHVNETYRPTLALDLMEPFRPVLGDRLMLRLINLGTLKASHFSEPNGPGRGTFISREGRELLLQVFSEWVQSCDETLAPTYRELTAPGAMLQKECERFARFATQDRLADFVPHYLDPASRPADGVNDPE